MKPRNRSGDGWGAVVVSGRRVSGGERIPPGKPRARRIARRGVPFVARHALPAPLVVAALLSGCANFDASVDPAAGLPDVIVEAPTFADVRPILERRCDVGGCHTPLTRQAGLVLAPDSAYEMLVGRRATLAPDLRRVEPGRADASWLTAMIGPDPARRRGLSRMPLASTPLTPNQIATIVRWIDRGAPRD
jgi:hypothetical protein